MARIAKIAKVSIRSIVAVTLLVMLESSRVCAFSNSSLNGNYVFSGTITLNNQSNLCGGSSGCGGVNNVIGSVGQFLQDLALDLTLRKCPAASQRLMSAITSIKSAKMLPGDQIFLAGLFTADGAGHFMGGQMTVSSTNAAMESMNSADQGSGALLCGGGALDGDCSFLCVPGSLGCDTQGGYNVGTEGIGSATVYAFPIAGSLCNGPSTLTFAECCNDPTLAIIFHQSLTLTTGDHASTIFTDQGMAGHGDVTAQ